MSNKITVSIILIVLMVITYTIYQGTVVIPRQEIESRERQARLDREAAIMAELRREQRYDDCLDSSYRVYASDWNSQCEIQGKETDCTLPNYAATIINDQYKEAKNRCVSLYKSN